MPIGVGAAMLLGSAVAGGSAIGAAKMQSNAASKAQKAQQAGTDKALQVQQETAAPYLQLGQAAAGRLGQMAATAQPYTQQFRPGQANNGFQAPPGLGSLGQPPSGPPQGPGGSPGMAQGALVTLRAPDGSTRQFPAQQAQQVMQQAAAAGHRLEQV